MSLLSKSEIQYLQGQKQVSMSYEYKLRSIIKKKVANLLDKEIPLLSSLFPNLDLTEFGKRIESVEKGDKEYLTNISKNTHNEKTKDKTSNSISINIGSEDLMGLKPKFYILSSINNQKENNNSSGGVEATTTIRQKGRTFRLSISPSQGDDPGFESRPEHIPISRPSQTDSKISVNNQTIIGH